MTKAFYEPHDFSGVTVFDPFLGSGTTVGEAHKLGCTALGRDITFDPHQGAAAGTKAKCPGCTQRFTIGEAVRAAEGPPAHRLYAKLLLFPDGTKRYLPATEADHRAYRECGQLLEGELQRGAIRLPTATLSDGYNTRQAIGYNYRRWRDFFNDRQLLALGWLQEAIAELPDPVSRDALFALFSGVLEFNNLLSIA